VVPKGASSDSDAIATRNQKLGAATVFTQGRVGQPMTRRKQKQMRSNKVSRASLQLGNKQLGYFIGTSGVLQCTPDPGDQVPRDM
jgi:hypothetical protein